MTCPFAKISPFVRYEFELAYNKPVTITAPAPRSKPI